MRKYVFVILSFVLSITFCAGQNNGSVSVLYSFSPLAGSQIELNSNLFLFKSKIGVDFSLSSNIESSESTFKIGILYRLYQNDNFKLFTGVRILKEYFYYEKFDRNMVAINWDFPIRLNYNISGSTFLSASINPAWNRFPFDFQTRVVYYNFGVGHYF